VLRALRKEMFLVRLRHVEGEDKVLGGRTVLRFEMV